MTKKIRYPQHPIMGLTPFFFLLVLLCSSQKSQSFSFETGQLWRIITELWILKTLFSPIKIVYFPKPMLLRMELYYKIVNITEQWIKNSRHYDNKEQQSTRSTTSTYLDMNFKRYRPHTWLEVEESGFPNTQPIS